MRARVAALAVAAGTLVAVGALAILAIVYGDRVK